MGRGLSQQIVGFLYVGLYIQYQMAPFGPLDLLVDFLYNRYMSRDDGYSMFDPPRRGRPSRRLNAMGLLHCPDCGLDKHPDEFYQRPKTGVYESYCRPCKNVRQRRYSNRATEHDRQLARAEAWENYLQDQLAEQEQWKKDIETGIADPSSAMVLPEMSTELIIKMQEQGIKMGPPDDGEALKKLRSLLEKLEE